MAAVQLSSSIDMKGLNQNTVIRKLNLHIYDMASNDNYLLVHSTHGWYLYDKTFEIIKHEKNYKIIEAMCWCSSADAFLILAREHQRFKEVFTLKVPEMVMTPVIPYLDMNCHYLTCSDIKFLILCPDGLILEYNLPSIDFSKKWQMSQLFDQKTHSGYYDICFNSKQQLGILSESKNTRKFYFSLIDSIKMSLIFTINIENNMYFPHLCLLPDNQWLVMTIIKDKRYLLHFTSNGELISENDQYQQHVCKVMTLFDSYLIFDTGAEHINSRIHQIQRTVDQNIEHTQES